jgi:hypothetical protein
MSAAKSVAPVRRRRGPALPLLLVLLLAGYALPLFAPPGGSLPAPAPPDAALLNRLFPGVPVWWVVGRLACWAAVVAFVLRWNPGWPAPPAAAPQRTPEQEAVSPRRMRLALGSAILQLAVLPWAPDFGRAAQLLYVAWFALPPALLMPWHRTVRGARDRRLWLVVGGIVCGWLLLRVPATWRSPRSADLLDTWIGLRFLAETADPGFNLLTGRVLPGSGSFHFIFQGAGLGSMVGGVPPLAVAQAAQVFWLAWAAVGVGWLGRRLFGHAAAAVSTAAFLFSPFASMMLLAPLPFFFYQLVIVGLLVLVVKVHDDRSLPALATLGALAGITATLHSAALVAGVVFCAALWSAWRRPRLPAIGVAVAISLFGGAMLTGLSDLRAMASGSFAAYTWGRAQWAGHEMAGFGQISPATSEYVVEGAISEPFDTPVSALLAPFALPRIPMRTLGDTLFDPIGASLSAIGVAACLGALRVSWVARLLLATLFVAILPASVSSQDRIPVIRLAATPVPMALLAGTGWQILRRWLEPARWVTLATAAVATACALGGMVVFDIVNPRILASSSTTLTLQALAHNTPPGGAAVLDHRKPKTFPYWYLDEIIGAIPRPSLMVRVYDHPNSLRRGAETEEPCAELIFWNPGLEEDEHVSRALCEQWPGAALYTLTDAAGGSRAFAARPRGPGWTPALPKAQCSSRRPPGRQTCCARPVSSRRVGGKRKRLPSCVQRRGGTLPKARSSRRPPRRFSKRLPTRHCDRKRCTGRGEPVR